MALKPQSLWRRLRTRLAVWLGIWRGRWHRFELETQVAQWTWWPWPWNRHGWTHALYHPAGLADDAAAPLVVVLHGCRQKALPFAQASGWVQAADRHGLRLLCPQQRRYANPFGCWNWFHPPAQAGRGELDVVMDAVDEARRRHRCTQVAVVGLSSGAGLAALLAFHRADDLAAVVAAAAPPLLGRGSLQDPRRVMRDGLAVRPTLAVFGLQRCAPLMVLHGTADDVVNPACGEQLIAQAHHVWSRGVVGLQAERPAHAAQPVVPGAAPDGAPDAAGDAAPADAAPAHATPADAAPVRQAWSLGGRTVLAHHRLPGLGHVWSGAPGGHAYVQREGPPMTDIAMAFLAPHLSPQPDAHAASPAPTPLWPVTVQPQAGTETTGA